MVHYRQQNTQFSILFFIEYANHKINLSFLQLKYDFLVCFLWIYAYNIWENSF